MSKRPSSDNPTNEGKIGSPSSAKTWGWPSRMMATSLLVVPRSIPTMASIGAILILSRFGYADLGVAKHAAPPKVAAPHFFDDFSGSAAAFRRHGHNFHQFRIERLANTRDRFQPGLLEGSLDS